MERIPFKLESDKKPSEEEIERLKIKVDEAAFLLKSWYTNKDSDSVREQAQRSRDYGQACHLLYDLIPLSQSLGQKIVLTNPDSGKPVDTYNFSKGAYDFISATIGRKPLEPGQSLELSDSYVLTDARQRVNFYYFGDLPHYVEAAGIGEFLCNEGKIEIEQVNTENNN